MLLIVVIVLTGITLILLMNYTRAKQNLKKLKNTSQKVASLNVLQDFIDIVANNTIDTDEKMNKVNSIMIEKFDIKYSTIVLFDGVSFNVETSNVGEKHYKMFEQLHEQEIFEDSIKNATPKYVTVDQSEKLPYLDMEFDRAKSAIFFPIYADNIYMGYWLIEGSTPHEFDNIDTTTLDVVKNNLVSTVRIIKKQRVIDNLWRVDKVTGLNTYEYLYGAARKTIDKYPTSIVSLIKIINLKQIEEKTSRKTAELALEAITDYLKECISPEYILVRYDADKLALVFSGSDLEGVSKFLVNLKASVEQLRVKITDSIRVNINGQVVLPKINIAVKSYYKETALEMIFKNLEAYLEETDSGESDITFL